MKVLHLIDHLGIGGAQTVVTGILTRDREQDCFAIRNKKASAVNIDNVYCSMSKSKLKLNVLTLFKIKKLILQNNYPILHCHLFAGYLYGYLLKRLWFPAIKLIFHEHGQIFRKQKLYDSFLNYSPNKVDLFIAVSEATKRKLIENAGIPENKIKVLYNFVDLEKFSPEVLGTYDRNGQREKLGINEEDFVIGFAGRLIERKGWRELCLAMKSHENRNIKLLIAGVGLEAKKLQYMIKELDMKREVIYLGLVNDILKFYSCIDCFIIPSHWEPLGITEIEAQACGIPIIATNVEGLNEVVSDKKTGLLFKPKNEKELAEKIELIERDKDLREKLVENGLFSVKKYSLDNYLIILGGFYAEVQYGKLK